MRSTASSPAELPALREAVAGLASEADYRKLADRFAVRRTNPQFWAASDALHEAYGDVGAAGSRAVRLQPLAEPLMRARMLRRKRSDVSSLLPQRRGPRNAWPSIASSWSCPLRSLRARSAPIRGTQLVQAWSVAMRIARDRSRSPASVGRRTRVTPSRYRSRLRTPADRTENSAKRDDYAPRAAAV